MAEGFLKAMDKDLKVFSAGINPSNEVHPKAIEVMKELEIDLSKHHPKSVEQFVGDSFDYVITVCDDAKENCPFFTGRVIHRLHIGFEDPAKAIGTEKEILAVFRRVRDEIREKFSELYQNKIERKN